ncbi:MAG: hypothetical protein WD177_05990, partial [Methylophaga sp.]
TQPCMLSIADLISLSSVIGEAVPTLRQVIDLVCRVAPRLIAKPEEYQEAGKPDFVLQGRASKKCEVGDTGDYSETNRLRSEV